ncbi:MAG: BrnT family toxin [Acidobacteriota bacterium]
MHVAGIIWLRAIVDKLVRKHGVHREEVKEVFDNRPRFRLVEKGQRQGENLYSATGKTIAGRHLIVFFIYKKDQRALIVSAREMTPSERKKHGKK